VPVQGEEDRGEGRGSGSPSLAKPTRDARRRADLRRGIPRSSLRLERNSKRGGGEEAMASLLRGLKGARVHYRGVIAGGKCFQ
jgi:hypothetical protein